MQADRKVLETKLANALKWRDLAERRLEEMGDLENKMADIHNAWAPTGFSDPNVSLSVPFSLFLALCFLCLLFISFLLFLRSWIGMIASMFFDAFNDLI